MAFSIRTLLAVIVLWAFYVAALTYHSPAWTMAAINLAIAILIVGTLGTRIGSLRRRFWIPFCFVGWLYVVVSFTPATINGLGQHLPSMHLSRVMIPPDDESQPNTRQGFIEYGAYFRTRSTRTADLDAMAAAFRQTDILHALSALVFGTLAGIVACVLLRNKPEQ